MVSAYEIYQLTGDITKKIPSEIWEAEEVRGMIKIVHPYMKQVHGLKHV